MPGENKTEDKVETKEVPLSACSGIDNWHKLSDGKWHQVMTASKGDDFYIDGIIYIPKGSVPWALALLAKTKSSPLNRSLSRRLLSGIGVNFVITRLLRVLIRCADWSSRKLSVGLRRLD